MIFSSHRKSTGGSLFIVCLAFLACSAHAAEGNSSGRIKLVVFDMELDDFSAGGPLAGESAAETARLQRMTALGRDLLTRSGLFEVLDPKALSNPMVRDHWLRKCNGCDADAANDLGAEMSFVGVYRKISIMEQALEIRIRDARTGKLVHASQADLRGETDESWSRALKFLIRYELVEPELRRRGSTAQVSEK